MDRKEDKRMTKYLILCGLLLLSLVPLSCSQKECEWRDIANFANHEVENSDDYRVISDDSRLTDPFSVNQTRLQIFCVSGLSDVESGGSLAIDLYHYPDMKFVKTAVDVTWTDDEVDFVPPTKSLFFAKVGKGMYCLYVSSSAYVTWALTVSECV